MSSGTKPIIYGSVRGPVVPPGTASAQSKDPPTPHEQMIWSPAYTVSNPYTGYNDPLGQSSHASFAFSPLKDSKSANVNFAASVGPGGAASTQQPQQQLNKGLPSQRQLFLTIPHMKKFLNEINANMTTAVTANDYAVRIVEVLGTKYDVVPALKSHMGGGSLLGASSRSGNSDPRIAILETEIAELRKKVTELSDAMREMVPYDRVRPVLSKAKVMKIGLYSLLNEIKDSFANIKKKMIQDVTVFAQQMSQEVANANALRDRAEKGTESSKEITKIIDSLVSSVATFEKDVEVKLRPLVTGTAPAPGSEVVDYSEIQTLEKKWGGANGGGIAPVMTKAAGSLGILLRTAGTMEAIVKKIQTMSTESSGTTADRDKLKEDIKALEQRLQKEIQTIVDQKSVMEKQSDKIRELMELNKKKAQRASFVGQTLNQDIENARRLSEDIRPSDMPSSKSFKKSDSSLSPKASVADMKSNKEKESGGGGGGKDGALSRTSSKSPPGGGGKGQQGSSKTLTKGGGSSTSHSKSPSRTNRKQSNAGGDGPWHEGSGGLSSSRRSSTADWVKHTGGGSGSDEMRNSIDVSQAEIFKSQESIASERPVTVQPSFRQRKGGTSMQTNRGMQTDKQTLTTTELSLGLAQIHKALSSPPIPEEYTSVLKQFRQIVDEFFNLDMPKTVAAIGSLQSMAQKLTGADTGNVSIKSAVERMKEVTMNQRLTPEDKQRTLSSATVQDLKRQQDLSNKMRELQKIRGDQLMKLMNPMGNAKMTLATLTPPPLPSPSASSQSLVRTPPALLNMVNNSNAAVNKPHGNAAGQPPMGSYGFVLPPPASGGGNAGFGGINSFLPSSKSLVVTKPHGGGGTTKPSQTREDTLANPFIMRSVSRQK